MNPEKLKERRSKYIGQKFGKLTVVGEPYHVKKPTTNGRISTRLYALFRCDCGKDHVADVSSVKRGIIKTCGCSRTVKNPNREPYYIKRKTLLVEALELLSRVYRGYEDYEKIYILINKIRKHLKIND